MAVIKLKRDEARQLLQKLIINKRFKSVEPDCMNATNYTDNEICDVLTAADRNNKYVIKEVIDAEEKKLLEQIKLLGGIV